MAQRIQNYGQNTPDVPVSTLGLFPKDYATLLMGIQYQIWNWKKTQERQSLYSLPNRHWAFVDPNGN